MAPEEERNDDLLAWVVGIAIAATIVLLLVLAFNLGEDRGTRNAAKTATTVRAVKKGAAAPKPAAAAGPGKALFAAKCGTCHTLAEAGTHGTVGPDLDSLKPNDALVLNALKIGGTGGGVMPKNLYTGKQAQQVAQFVSQATGGGQ